MTVEAAAYADEMITQSTVTGMSVESLQAYSYTADLVDVSLDTLSGSMAKHAKSMASAADGSAKYADAYAQLGVAVTNTDGTLRGSEDVYSSSDGFRWTKNPRVGFTGSMGNAVHIPGDSIYVSCGSWVWYAS